MLSGLLTNIHLSYLWWGTSFGMHDKAKNYMFFPNLSKIVIIYNFNPSLNPSHKLLNLSPLILTFDFQFNIATFPLHFISNIYNRHVFHDAHLI